MLSTIKSSGLCGIQGYLVEVEVDMKVSDFPGWTTVGLAESEVKESKERVISAIRNSGFNWEPQKVTINLAPADIKKQGTAHDIPMAVGLLVAQQLIPDKNVRPFLMIGELSLDGRVRKTKGVLAAALLAQKSGLRGVIFPQDNWSEVRLVEGVSLIPVANLAQVVSFLRGEASHLIKKSEKYQIEDEDFEVDMADICGQEKAKRALEIAASGGHHLLLSGPPGTGKSMLAKTMISILPPLSLREAIETTQIYSLLDHHGVDDLTKLKRPFRSPHHSISDAGLAGGGQHIKPGEISLAHNGVLFLDEFPEYKRNVIEILREPLETGEVSITRASQSIKFPSRFSLVAAMNPCPCGYASHPKIPCVCDPARMRRYKNKISGPILDRFDLMIEAEPVPFEALRSKQSRGEGSSKIRKKVLAARTIQEGRYRGSKTFCNAQMTTRQIEKFCPLESAEESLLKNLAEKKKMSARAIHRLLKVARTLADMEMLAQIQSSHLLEAFQYRYHLQESLTC